MPSYFLRLVCMTCSHTRFCQKDPLWKWRCFASQLDTPSQCAQITVSEIITFIDIAQDWGISWCNLSFIITSLTSDRYVIVAVSVGILVRLWVTTLQWYYVSHTWSACVLIIWVCLSTFVVHVVWDVMVCGWATGYQHIEGLWSLRNIAKCWPSDNFTSHKRVSSAVLLWEL